MSSDQSTAFTDFFHTAPVPMCLVGRDGVILDANQAELALLGYDIEAYVGRPAAVFHADAGVAADVTARLTRGEPLRQYEARLRCADGSIRHVQLTSEVQHDGDRLLHTFCVTRDVTEAKMAERRLAVQFRVAQILAAATDTVDGLRRALTVVCEELGWDVAEVWQRDDCADVLHLLTWIERPGIHADALARLGRESTLAKGEGLPGQVWATGGSVWIDDIATTPDFQRAGAAAAAGLRTACGIPFALVGDVGSVLVFFRREPERDDEVAVRTLRLIAGQLERFLERERIETERERLLERERHARLEAELANRAKDEFLAAVSHELRTPLNAILGWSRLLRGGAFDADTIARGLAAVERNAEVQEQLISDLLDVARIVTGKIQLRLDRTDLAGVVEAAIDAVRHGAAAKSIVLDTRLVAPVPTTLADADRLQQVVCNLLSNAIRFTPEGGHVRVELAAVGDRIIIRVVDDGIGIDPEFLPHVFDRFCQGEVGTTRRQRGLGLGLSIVRHLTELHGGVVRAASEGEGRGATFTVELPVIEPAPLVPRPTDPSAAEAPAVSLAHVCVLLVDDDADARDMLGMVLGSHGARVRAAATAEEAMAAFRRDSPDVVVSDIGLPDSDGYSLIRRLRALDAPAARTAVAIALTGWARNEDRAAALEAGFQAHVVKPVDPAELVRLMARLVTTETPEPVAGTGIAAS